MLLIFLSLASSEPITADIGILGYQLYENGTASVLRQNTENVVNLSIPRVVEYQSMNYTVISIQPKSFYLSNISGIVTLPDSLIYIGESSFHGTKITGELIIPDSVEEIGKSAFYETHISSVVFGKNLRKIYENAFFNCFKLSCELKFPNSLEYIGDFCFILSGVTGVIDLSMLNYIGTFSFAGTFITSVIFPSFLEKVPDYLFSDSKLKGEVIIPSTVLAIGEGAFTYTLITKINFPIYLHTIGSSAFAFCTLLEVSIPSAYTFEYIGRYAFALTKVTATLIHCNKIDECAFSYCKALTDNIGIIANSIGESAFGGCPNIKSIDLTIHNSINSSVFMQCTSLEVLTVYDSTNVIEIGYMAFAFCDSLIGIFIPDTVEVFGNKSFYMCESYAASLDFTIYPNLRIIGNEAFYGCKSMFGELRLPDSLNEIGDNSFICGPISGSIIIPDSVQKIGSYAFFNCENLDGIISIGNNVTKIGDSAFALCSNIAGNIILGRSIEIIGHRAFFGCSKITGSITLPSDVTIIGDSAFYHCSSLVGTLLLPSKISYIGDNSFAECTGLTGRLIIPNSVTSIGMNAFFNCYGIEDVFFESKSTTVGVFAFSHMHIKCFSNTPQSIIDNIPEKYSSDNMKGNILPNSFLNFECQSFYGIDTFLTILFSVVGSGGFITVASFIFSWYNSRKTNIKTYTDVFNEIINTVCKHEEIDDDEKTQRIINKINSRLNGDQLDEDLDISQSQANKALQTALDESWSTITKRHKRRIFKESFNDITFKKPCFQKCTKESEDINLAELKGTLIV
jgi:hypothetical protein